MHFMWLLASAIISELKMANQHELTTKYIVHIWQTITIILLMWQRRTLSNKSKCDRKIMVERSHQGVLMFYLHVWVFSQTKISWFKKSLCTRFKAPHNLISLQFRVLRFDYPPIITIFHSMFLPATKCIFVSFVICLVFFKKQYYHVKIVI